MKIFTKLTLFTMVLILAVSSIYSVSAQSDVINTINNKDLMNKALDLDNTLTPTITATLTGLSLTGGTFLVNLARTKEDMMQFTFTWQENFSSRLSLCF